MKHPQHDHAQFRRIQAQDELIASKSLLIRDLQKELAAVHASTSWRITAPLRYSRKPITKLLNLINLSPLKNAIKLRLVYLAFRFLKYFPNIKKRLSRYHVMHRILKYISDADIKSSLPQTDQDVFTELKYLMKTRNEV